MIARLFIKHLNHFNQPRSCGGSTNSTIYMHAQVPQYLEVEDKIIGPLTLKQFLYLLVGGGIIFLLYTILKFSVFIIVAMPIGLFVILLAFYKKDNQKFTQFVANFLKFISRPNIYIWKKSVPTKTEEEPMPKIVKKTVAWKQPESSELKETQWKMEIQK